MALVVFSVLAVELHTGQISNLGKIVKQADSDSSPGFMEAEKENEKEIRKPAQKFPWLLVAAGSLPALPLWLLSFLWF